MVDNILNDKEDRSESVSSDTESDATSDIKDSLCGSPRSDTLLLPSNDERPLNISESLLRTYAMIRQGGHLCCSKCGHFQVAKRNAGERHMYDDGDHTDSVTEFKCDMCGCTEPINAKETILKETGVGITKPILKFSVSAILGDRKDCVKVRNGKQATNNRTDYNLCLILL